MSKPHLEWSRIPFGRTYCRLPGAFGLAFRRGFNGPNGSMRRCAVIDEFDFFATLPTVQAAAVAAVEAT